MGLIFIPFASPPAGPVLQRQLQKSPEEESSLPEQLKDDLKGAQPTAEAPAENLCLCLRAVLAFSGHSLDYPGKGTSFDQALTSQPAPPDDGEGEEMLVLWKADNRNHMDMQGI